MGPWSDIYALGMVAYRCISGVSDGELPDAVTRGRVQRKGGVDLVPVIDAGKGQYSPRLLAAIDWALEMDEGERPQSVNEWQTALAGGKTRIRTPQTIREPTTRSTKGATQRAGVSRTGMALIVVIAAILVGAGAWLGWQLYRGATGESMSGLVTALLPQVETHTEPQTGTEPQTEIVVETETRTAGAEDTASVDEAESDTEQQPIKPATPAKEDEVIRLLAAAEADLKARRLTSPVGNNAWERYQDVLKLDSSNSEAVRGMERVIESYMELFGAAVEQEDFEQASSYLDRIRDLHPDSPSLLTGTQSLEVARQARAARLTEQEQQRQAEEAARQAELHRQQIKQAMQAHWAAFEVALGEENLNEAAGIMAHVSDLNPEEPELAAGEQRLEAARIELEHKRQESLKRELAGEMVSIPGGTFRMGDLSGEGRDAEKPVHSVTVSDFMLGKYEVTFSQWDACVADGGCGRYQPDDDGWGRGNRPLINISWDDIQTFIDWLNEKTGRNYRLPTEAEWEYAARAGSTTKYSWGNSIGHNRANCDDDCGDRWKYTAPAGSFSANVWGLHDMHGNVWEWVQDCWNDSYVGAPGDGRAWSSGDCGLRVVRGGSWPNDPGSLRSAGRYGGFWSARSDRGNYLGFRLAQDK